MWMIFLAEFPNDAFSSFCVLCRRSSRSRSHHAVVAIAFGCTSCRARRSDVVAEAAGRGRRQAPDRGIRRSVTGLFNGGEALGRLTRRRLPRSAQPILREAAGAPPNICYNENLEPRLWGRSVAGFGRPPPLRLGCGSLDDDARCRPARRALSDRRPDVVGHIDVTPGMNTVRCDRDDRAAVV